MELGMASQALDERGARCRPDESARLAAARPGRDLYAAGIRRRAVDVAEEHLKRSIELFAKDAPKPGEPAWGKGRGVCVARAGV